MGVLVVSAVEGKAGCPVAAMLPLLPTAAGTL